jgi:hypothetical protein
VAGDRIKEACTVTGTGSISLTGSVPGYRNFATYYSNGQTLTYVILNSVDNTWEVGIGTYVTSGNAITRNTILNSSIGGSIVSFGTGTLTVWNDISATEFANTSTPNSVIRANSSGLLDVSWLAGTSPALSSPTVTTQTLGDNTTKTASTAFVTTAITQNNNTIVGKSNVKFATTTVLPANTYSNGTSGVGATLTATSNGALTVDGTALSLNDSLLVKNEATAANNGIYTLTTLGTGSVPYVLTRRTDFDASADISAGDEVLVVSGTVNTATIWYLSTAGTITTGTTAINFVQVSVTNNTETLTNKNIVKRLTSVATGTSISINSDNSDIVSQTNTQSAGTLTVNNPTGSPVDCQLLAIRLKSTNAQTFSFGTQYRASTDLALPTVSSASSKWDYMLFVYNSADTKWDILASNFGH